MKKLDDIIIDPKAFREFIELSVVRGEWHLQDTFFAQYRLAANIVVIGIGPASGSFLKPGIQFVCDVAQDYGTIYLGFVQLRDYPEAMKMLWHYLTGKGESVEVDTGRVMREDTKLREQVFCAIGAQIKKGQIAGKVNPKQKWYGNQNWLNAFGSILIHWTKGSDEVVLWISDTYRWHPLEANRNTQCVHQAMERAKNYGAQDFDYRGTAMYVRLSELQKSICPQEVSGASI